MANKLMIVMVNTDPANATEPGAYVIQQAMDDNVVTFTY